MASGTVAYKKGDLIKWYEYYSDGFMVRDAGYGIVIKNTEVPTRCSNDVSLYRVFRMSYSDIITFSGNEIEKVYDT